jgi:hypothetical protein
VNSAIQSGGPGAQQTVAVSGVNLSDVEEILQQYEAKAGLLDLPEDAAAELAAEIGTVRAQIASPKSKHKVIRGSMLTAKATLNTHRAERPPSACLT